MILKRQPNQMAQTIKLISPDDIVLFNVKNHIIDLCESYTVIYDRQFFSKFRIFDKIDNIDTDNNRIRVNYSTGAYLLIRP
jgi:hypothetical protein